MKPMNHTESAMGSMRADVGERLVAPGASMMAPHRVEAARMAAEVVGVDRVEMGGRHGAHEIVPYGDACVILLSSRTLPIHGRRLRIHELA